MFAQVSIIIVNWNAGSQLAECIASIAQYHHGLVSSVIIVDNASTDDSLVQVEALQSLPFQPEIVRNTDNRGFGAACNQGAALATSEYLLFLNPDTRLFENSLSTPLAFMQKPENAEVGIVGIQLLDENKNISKSCSRFPTTGTFISHSLGVNRFPGLGWLSQPMVDWDHSFTRPVDQVMGAFFFIRRSVFESLGGFDERFYVYFEEVDLSLRAKHQGWNSVYLADAQAFHAGGGTTNQVKAHRLFYSLRSRIIYSFKHFVPIGAWSVCLVTLVIEPVTRVLRCLARGAAREAMDTLRGFALLWKDMPCILSKIKI